MGRCLSAPPEPVHSSNTEHGTTAMIPCESTAKWRASESQELGGNGISGVRFLRQVRRPGLVAHRSGDSGSVLQGDTRQRHDVPLFVCGSPASFRHPGPPATAERALLIIWL